MHLINVRITLTEEMLGTCSSTPEVHREFIASKAPDAPSTEEEVEAIGVDAVVEKGMTIFARETDGRIFLWNYMLKGFFKTACSALKRASGSDSSKITSYRKVVNEAIFINPRKMYLQNYTIGNCQRPLRIEDRTGQRVALANSETVQPGTYFDATIKMISPTMEDAVREWLDYGQDYGLGQWRNSGKGTFTWKELK